ncbi:MAG: hypothetical protein WC544_03280 [Patescibacteria group bacterium]
MWGHVGFISVVLTMGRWYLAQRAIRFPGESTQYLRLYNALYIGGIAVVASIGSRIYYHVAYFDSLAIGISIGLLIFWLFRQLPVRQSFIDEINELENCQ